MPLVLAIALLIGLALTAVGLRGRRTDDHPLCRRCRFDLTGRPDGSTRCPECGADLTGPRATVVGHRRRRRGLLLAGLLVLVPTLGLAGVVGWGRAADVNWLAYAPTGYLLRQAGSADAARRTPALAELAGRSPRWEAGQWDAATDAAIAYQADPSKPWDTGWGSLLEPDPTRRRPSPERWAGYLDGLAGQATSDDPTRRHPALVELARRLADGAVDDATWRHVVETGLAYQGDLGKPWETDWGTLLEQAHAAGRLPGDGWSRYARQAVSLGAYGLRLRPRVRQGDPVPYWVDQKGDRAGSSTGLRCTMSDLRLTWDGPTAASTPAFGGHSTFGVGGGGASGSQVDPDQLPAGLAIGTQHVHLTATADVRAAAPGGWDVDEKVPPLASSHLDLPGTFDLLAADQPTVKVIHNPALAEAVHRSVSIDSVRQQAGTYRYVNVTVTVKNPPVGLAFDIVLVQGGHDFKAGTLACPAGTGTGGSSSYATGGSNVRLPGPTADVTLRGRPSLAAGTTDTFEAWDGQVVFKGVTVEHPKQ